MQHMPGQRLGDCFEALSISQKQRTADDLAAISHSLYNITATHCGSLLRDLLTANPPCTPHYGERPEISPSVVSSTHAGRFTAGPANDFAFMEYLDCVYTQFEDRGPLSTERGYMEGLGGSRILRHLYDAASQRDIQALFVRENPRDI